MRDRREWRKGKKRDREKREITYIDKNIGNKGKDNQTKRMKGKYRKDKTE